MLLVLRIVGVIMVVLGLSWALQGTGLLPYPASSPMIGQTRWIGFGIILAVLGLVLLSRARQIAGPR